MRDAWGHGLATIDAHGAVLDAWYPELGLGEMPASSNEAEMDAAQHHDDVRDVEVIAVHTTIDLDAAPASATDLYLRLHLLSNRVCQPRTINLSYIAPRPTRTIGMVRSRMSASRRSERCSM